jgi:uncharacterized membrane protein
MLNVPLHPLLVHFPIAFLVIGTLFAIISIWRRDFFDKGAFFMISFGLLSGIIAYLSGDGAERFASTHWGNGYRKLVGIHQLYATMTLLLFGSAVGIRLLFSFYKRKILIPIVAICCLLGSGALAMTGHYGGQMVYVQKHAVPAQTTNQP